jgi:SWIM zinc finger
MSDNTKRFSGGAAGGAAGNALRGLVAARSDPMRLLRGAELAERGYVTELQIGPGDLRAFVSGSRREASTVKITTPVTGALPGAGSPIRWSCTCPDWGDPCKHAVAVVLAAAQRFEDDPEQVEQFIGTVMQPDLGTVDENDDGQDVGTHTDTSLRVARSGRSTELPVVAPLWAEGLGDVDEPTTARLFFGDTPPGGTSFASSVAASSDMAFGPDRLRELGPLIVDTYDLAPDIIRMYTGLRDS